MNQKRVLSLILCGLLCLPTVSCGASGGSVDTVGGGSSDSVENTEPAETDRSEIKDDLPAKDYKGDNFNILYRNEWAYEFVAEEQTGDIINDAIHERNRKVEERFNVKLNFIGVDGGWNSQSTFLNTLNGAILAGDASYDLVAGYQAYMITPAMEGYLMNINDLANIDPSAPWWSEKCNESLSVGGRLYLTTGDIAITMWNNMFVYYFNKKLADEYQVPDLYQLVRDGKWTLDKLYEITNGVSRDINGDTVFDDKDLYGFVTAPSNHMRAYMVMLELPLVKQNADGVFEEAFNNERTQSALEKLCMIHHTGNSCYYQNSVMNEPNDTAIPTIFTENRALIMSGYLSSANILRSMETDFGIIPYPKLDEKQESYHTSSHNSVSMICFPVTLRDPEMSGIITEALCAESYRTVIPKYYDIALKAKGARDEESGKMIDLIRDGLVFDFGWVHSVPMNSIGTILDTLVANNSTNLQSEWATRQSGVLNGLKKINEAYGKITE